MEGAEISMTDEEFNVLDELYFVQPFSELVSLTGYQEEELILVLRSMFAKGWIRFMKYIDTDWEVGDVKDSDLRNSYFLATKNGLLVHNG